MVEVLTGCNGNKCKRFFLSYFEDKLLVIAVISATQKKNPQTIVNIHIIEFLWANTFNELLVHLNTNSFNWKNFILL